MGKIVVVRFFFCQVYYNKTVNEFNFSRLKGYLPLKYVST